MLPPPPRPRGRGWWRRARLLAIWLTAGPLGIAVSTGVTISALTGPGGPVLGLAIIFGGAGAIVLALLVRVVWKNLREIGLLRHGVELVTRGSGAELSVFHGDLRRTLEPPGSRENLIRVGEPAEVRGFLVLASPDLSRHFFPDLRDVPAERLVRGEEIEPRLPLPVRSMTPEWKMWMRRQCLVYRTLAILISLPIATGILVLVLAGGSPTPWGVTGIASAAEGVIILAWLRRYWRTGVLWREGEEIHAVVLKRQADTKGVLHCEVTYTYRGKEFGRAVRVPVDLSLCEAPSPRGAAAVTPRVVLLIDPYAPKRWTWVPISAVPAPRQS